MNLAEMTRSERIEHMSRVIAAMSQDDPDHMAECKTDHRSHGRTYLQYKIEMMDTLHELGAKQYQD